MKSKYNKKDKLIIKSIKSFLLEETQEFNQIPNVSPQETVRPMNISLDQKVDSFFVQYEKESVPTAEAYGNDVGKAIARKSIGTNVGTLEEKIKKVTSVSLKNFIFEADDPNAGLDAGVGGAGMEGDLAGAGGDLNNDLGAGMGGDTSAETDDQEIKVASPVINLESFTERLARLINNHEELLDPKTIILNRAYVFLVKNYNEQVAKEMMISMETNYKITPKTDREKQDQLVGMGPFSAAGQSSAIGGGG